MKKAKHPDGRWMTRRETQRHFDFLANVSHECQWAIEAMVFDWFGIRYDLLAERIPIDWSL